MLFELARLSKCTVFCQFVMTGLGSNAMYQMPMQAFTLSEYFTIQLPDEPLGVTYSPVLVI